MLDLKPLLREFEQMGIKPNYSELSRRYKKDRHTIKRMFLGLNDPPKQRKPRLSQLDPLADEIGSVLKNGTVGIRSAYWYFKNERGVGCTYSNFKSYVRRKGLASPKACSAPHPLYETDPGKQLQCDWVEDITLRTADGGKVTFNLFSATLSWSRMHYFEYTPTKTEAAFKRCLCHCLEWLGGRPAEVLTDNMSALVAVRNGRRFVHPTVHQFFRDIDVRIRFCKARTPETKGKDESSNRFAKWLLAYDGKIAGEADAKALAERLTRDINREVNQSTGVMPALAFGKEKEHLMPLPSREMLGAYESWSHSCTVPQTQLVYYRGARYSVPPNYISKEVQIEEDGECVYIFHDGVMIARHESSGPGMHYDEGHLREGLSLSVGSAAADSIDEFIGRTMSRFKGVGDV